MRTCRSCGRENADDTDFCACGEYLRWEPTNYMPAAAPAGGAGPSAAAPADLDPNVTLAGDPVRPGSWRAGDGPPAPGLPGSGDAPPGAAALMLRRPDDDGGGEGLVSVAVEPGQRVTIIGLIRNQSQVVDNFDLQVKGLPAGWWTVTPATAYLVPYGSGGTYEQEFEVHVHPPRSPDAQARPWAFEVVAVSRSYGGQVAAAAASVTVGPYFEVATELRPERAAGRLKARYRLVVRNRANARTEVAVGAEDSEGTCRFRFAAPSVSLDPGTAVECPFTVFPPKQIWIGRGVERRFQVIAEPVGLDLPQAPRQATFRQRPWLPWWLAIVIPIVVAIVVVVLMLMPKQKPIPNVAGLPSVAAAQKKLTAAGFTVAPKHVSKVDPSKPPGSIAGEIPPAGTKEKGGFAVTLQVFVGTGKVAVPSLVGLTVSVAEQDLIASGLQLGTVSPALKPNGKIVNQLPPAGTQVAEGTSITVFLKQPKPVVTGPTGASGATAASGVSGVSGVTGVSGVSGATGATLSTGASGATAASGVSGATGSSASTGTTGASGGTGASGATGGGPPVVRHGPVTIPRLTGDPVAATRALAKLGLKVATVERISAAPAGQVVATVPVPGTTLKRGSTVTLVISRGTPQLAYDDGQSIHVINSASLKASGTVPAGTGPSVEPSWSRDATHIVYSQNGQLVLDQPGVANAAPFQLTAAQTGVTNLNPSFAPTLKALVIAFIERTATTAQLCFGTVSSAALTPSCTSVPGWDLGGQVAWSPDGSTILVLGTQNAGTNFGLIAFKSSVPFSAQASDWGTGTPVTDSSVAGHGVFAGAFSPGGKRMALVSNIGSSAFHLYVVPAGDFKPTAAQELPVSACQIAWRSDGKVLAVMQADSQCGPAATGTIVAIKLTRPNHSVILATQAAHPAWQPLAKHG